MMADDDLPGRRAFRQCRVEPSQLPLGIEMQHHVEKGVALHALGVEEEEIGTPAGKVLSIWK